MSFTAEVSRGSYGWRNSHSSLREEGAESPVLSRLKGSLVWHWAPHSRHFLTVLDPCCLQPLFSKVTGELLPAAGTSFSRHLLKPPDQNSPAFSWLLNPVVLLFIMRDGKPMQMLYFGKMPGTTGKKKPPKTQTSLELEAADALGRSW